MGITGKIKEGALSKCLNYKNESLENGSSPFCVGAGENVTLCPGEVFDKVVKKPFMIREITYVKLGITLKSVLKFRLSELAVKVA